MGNNSVKGDIYIQTDVPCYYQGEVVTGKVHLNLKSPFDADHLSLKVKGYEETQWKEEKQRSVERQGEDGTQTTEIENYTEEYEEKKTFFSQKFPLWEFPGNDKMQPGQYTFPFQFKLTDDIPGTFHEKGKFENQKGEYKAIIKYKVKVEIEGAHDEKLKNKQELIVKELVKNFGEGQQAFKVVKPTTWCCIGQGESSMKCYFQKNSYIPGETAFMCADLDNSKCKLDMTDMTVTFNKTLKLKGKLDGKGAMHEKIIKTVIQKCKFSGVKAGEKAVDENKRQAQINLMKEKKHNVPPSTKGKLVNCQYDLSVLANLSGCICCASEPEVSLNLNIYSPPPINYGVVQAPPNWNPQVYEVKNFAFSDQYAYLSQHPQQNMVNQQGFNQPPNPANPLMQPPKMY